MPDIKTPRHGFTIGKMPSNYTGTLADYCATVDTAFEHADAIATGNGVSYRAALSQVMKDQGWRLTLDAQAQIMRRLKE